MSRRITFKSKNIVFPPRCVVCQAQSDSLYTVRRMVSHANRSIPVAVRVPLCARHYSAAVEVSPRERRARRTGMLLGGVCGLLALIALLRMWSVPGQSITLLNLFVAALVGISLFMLVWGTFNLFVGPLLAGPDVIAARHGVRILRYWPLSGQIQLEFEDEDAADAIADANHDQVVLAQ